MGRKHWKRSNLHACTTLESFENFVLGPDGIQNFRERLPQKVEKCQQNKDKRHNQFFMQFHKEELDDLMDWNNLNNLTFHKIKCMVVDVKNMYVLIYGRFAMSYRHDAALKTEIVYSAKRDFSTREGSAR